MDVVRRSTRRKSTRVTYTPGKINTRPRNVKHSRNDHTVSYTLDRNKAIEKKLEATRRPFTVTPVLSPGNLVLVFSAAAYEEFKQVTLNVLNSLSYNVNTTSTSDKTGVIISESLVVKENSVKLFVLNFYNSTSKVLLNGKQNHVLEFVNSTLRSILEILDRNSDFMSINCHIRKYCEEFLSNKTRSQTYTRDSNCSGGGKTAISDHTTNNSNCSNSEKTITTVHSSDLVCLSGNDNSAVMNPPALSPSIMVSSDESPSCPVCDKPCGEHSRSVACDNCDRWLHYKCENLSQRDIKLYESDITNNYICHSCTNLIDQNSTANNPALDNENTLVKIPPSPLLMGRIVHKHAPTSVKSIYLCKQSQT